MNPGVTTPVPLALAFGFVLSASASVFFRCDGVLDPAPRESSVHPGRGGFIRPMQDASAPCDAIGRGCHQRDGFTGPGFWAGNPAPTTLGRSPAPADDQRRAARRPTRVPWAFGFVLSAFGFRDQWPRVCWRSVAGVTSGTGSPGPGFGREIPPLQRWVDHPGPLVMNGGVTTPVPRALAFGFVLSAFGFRDQLSRLTERSVAGVTGATGSPWPGFGREIPPLQRCVDHPCPLVMNGGVTTPVPRAFGCANPWRPARWSVL
jgi:hypothetical protein